MGETLANVVSKLGQTTFYPTLFQAAFGTPDVTSDRISQALAQFERSMVSYQSKYDSAFAPGSTTPNFAAAGFTADELAGEQLFNGAGRCSACHTTNAHVSNRVHNIGLDATITDAGAGNGKFKAPSLRNIAVSDRFMHDGRFTSLEEVVQFYSTGVQDSQYLDPLLKTPLQLNFTQQQIDQLVAFLNTLTDNTFLTSSLFSDPFVTLPGDYNGDGVVDEVDYNVWRGNFGDSTSLVADGNGDNVVDGADYLTWRKNVGKTWQDLATGAGGELAVRRFPSRRHSCWPESLSFAVGPIGRADDRHDETGVTRGRLGLRCASSPTPETRAAGRNGDNTAWRWSSAKSRTGHALHRASSLGRSSRPRTLPPPERSARSAAAAMNSGWSHRWKMRSPPARPTLRPPKLPASCRRAAPSATLVVVTALFRDRPLK